MAKIEVYKKETLWDKTKRKAGEAWDWTKARSSEIWEMAKKRPDLAVEVGAGIIGVLGAGVSLATKASDKHRSETEVWDAELGKKIKLKRPMTKDELAEYDERLQEAKVKKTRQSRYSILKEMGLTK